MEQVNKGLMPPKTLRISIRDLLVATNRTIDGRGYKLLHKALKRLQGVSITTNIKTNKREQIDGFGLIDSYHIVESSKVKKRMVRLEITLSDWFYNSIVGKEVLTINRQYFRLRQPTKKTGSTSFSLYSLDVETQMCYNYITHIILYVFNY